MQNDNKNSEYLVEVRDVVKHYGDKRALNGINVKIKESQTIAIIGPNGAGKTTFIECLLNLRQPDSGSINIFGIDVLKHKRDYLEDVGAHLQGTRLFPKVTPRHYLEFYSGIYERTMDVDEVVAWLELDSFMDKKLGQLSGGMKQRVSLALAVINDPRLIMLDEPTVGLDPIARQEFWGLIKKLQQDNKTIIFSTHYMDEATELADEIIMIHQGTAVFKGPPSMVIDKAKALDGTLDQAYTYFVEQAAQKAGGK